MAHENPTSGNPDRRDVDEVVDAHYLILLKYAAKMGASPEDANDIVQTAFVEFLQRPHWHGAKPLYKTVATKFADLRRAQLRDRRLQARFTARQDEDQINRTSSFDTMALQAVPDARLALPAEMQMLLFLKFDQNRSIREIAVLFGRRPASVRRSLKKAMRALCQELAARGVSAETASSL